MSNLMYMMHDPTMLTVRFLQIQYVTFISSKLSMKKNFIPWINILN